MPKTVKMCVEKMVALIEKECKKAKKDEKYKIDNSAVEKVILNSAPLKRGAKNPSGKPAKKRPLSGYMKFAQKMRPQIVKDNPKFSIIEIMKEIAKQWNALSETEKDKYKK